MSTSEPAGRESAVESPWNNEVCGTRGVGKTHRKAFFERIGIRADAECLPFESETFDIVRSHRVLHYSPDNANVVQVVYRVLKPVCEARIKIYHVPSCVALMLWTSHCLLKGRPFRSPRWAV
jgi:SAM-dependent methyltransferase